MRTFVAAWTLLSCSLPGQDRLLQAEDLPARATAAALLEFGLDTQRGQPHAAERLRAAVATARECLPAGSAAWRRVDQMLASADPDRLRLAAAALQDDLSFQPRSEASLPDGMPGYLALDELELRRYPAYRMVRTDMRGGGMGAFWPLFEHIKQREIAMTTPVQIDYAADDERMRGESMAFLYGSPDLGPTGRDGRVEVVDVPAMTVLTVGSRGYDRQSRIAELRARLEAWLAANPAWVQAGPIRTMGYNSPSVRGEERYFEVQIPVRPRADSV